MQIFFLGLGQKCKFATYCPTTHVTELPSSAAKGSSEVEHIDSLRLGMPAMAYRLFSRTPSAFSDLMTL